jgi:hypothetical protein
MVFAVLEDILNDCHCQLVAVCKYIYLPAKAFIVHVFVLSIILYTHATTDDVAAVPSVSNVHEHHDINNNL